MRAHILTAVALLAALSPTTAIAATLNINNLMFDESEDRWLSYSYEAFDTVKSLNEISSKLTLQGHKALNLGSASSTSRLAYMLTAGLLNHRIQWANSIYFGHELVHFQHAHGYGLDQHYFREDPSGQRLSRFEAYKRLFLKGEVGGPAVSARGDQFDSDRYQDHGISTTIHATNWQVHYSEQWIRDALWGENKTVFDSSDFLANRLYQTSYALGDYLRYTKEKGTSGDIYKFARNIEPNSDPKKVLAKIFVLNAAAVFASPATQQTSGSISRYITDATTDFTLKRAPGRIGTYFWDIPTFMNEGSLTAAPTLYLDMHPEAASGFYADKLLVSMALETAVMGTASNEARFALTGKWGALTTDVGVALNGDGQYLEAKLSYQVADKASVYAGLAQKHGDTLRGRRLLPDSDQAVWTGIQIKF